MTIMEDKFWHRAARVKGSSYDRLNRDLVRVNITITKGTLEALREKAVSERRSIAGTVRELVIKGLAQ